MKVLISGFAPFGKDKVNPSLEAIRQLPLLIDNKIVIPIELPVVAYESLNLLFEAIETHKPDYVLCIGQAGGRKDITIERIGINIDDFGIEDNKGNIRIDQAIYEDGADAYFTTLPNKRLIEVLKQHEIPASISNTAGTFVCNHVTYGVQHYLRKHRVHCKAGFVHIPYIPQQNHLNSPSMELSMIVNALTHIITHISDEEIIKSEGKIC